MKYTIWIWIKDEQYDETQSWEIWQKLYTAHMYHQIPKIKIWTIWRCRVRIWQYVHAILYTTGVSVYEVIGKWCGNA